MRGLLLSLGAVAVACLLQGPAGLAQEPKAVLQGHTACVHAVAFSPDGQRLATGGENLPEGLGTLRLWT